jgi:hypothetical protein
MSSNAAAAVYNHWYLNFVNRSTHRNRNMTRVDQANTDSTDNPNNMGTPNNRENRSPTTTGTHNSRKKKPIMAEKAAIAVKLPETRAVKPAKIASVPPGGESSSLFPGARRPKITFLEGDVRVGLIVSDTIGCSFYRGDFEILLDGFAAGITDGPGNWLVGGRVFGRYNFIRSGARVVPYLQVSAGALGNDIYRDHTQKIIGGGFEFTTGVSMGVRFLISRHFGVLLEGGYQHISNADIYPRNAGLTALGAQAGLFYFF